ncbi:MAG: PqqD family peptide modification chaperone [Lachnospiraceae bacterium]|nr:PqqD family peptide modification chaperone [Eubacterium sp.]MBQ5446990.1 PqqD family peptide modification chaperone [Lachnospiraceae bacterium]
MSQDAHLILLIYEVIVDMYPVLNEMIYLEKKQPTYSDFSIKYNGMDLKFSVNNTAADILELCNGENSIADIVDSLAEKFNEDINKVYLFVNEFIENSVKIGNVIIRSEVSQKRELQIIGTSDYWSLDLVSIELTYTCPLNCRHCYANAGKGNFISYDLVDKILTECKEFGKPQIQLTGGEPLTHPDFFRIVKKAVDNDFNVVIFTSGYIDNETIINKIMKFPRERVSFQISVDGLEEYHNRFRGRSDAFRTTENFIKKLCKMGFRVTTATCIDD